VVLMLSGYSRVSASDMAVTDDAVYIVGDVWQAGPQGIFLIEKLTRIPLGLLIPTILGD
jgi:hypothetical protein